MDHPLTYIACLVRGHDWGLSRTREGHVVCTACGVRKRESKLEKSLERKPLPRRASALAGLTPLRAEPPRQAAPPVSQTQAPDGGWTWTVTMTCEACNAPLRGEGDFAENDMIGCAACGTTTLYGDALRRAAEVSAEHMAREIVATAKRAAEEAGGADAAPLSLADVKRQVLAVVLRQSLQPKPAGAGEAARADK